MTSKCGKNKNVAHEAIAECVTDVLTIFWRHLWLLTEQTHGIFLFHIIRKQNKNLYASGLYGVLGLHNCLEFSVPPWCLDEAIKTEKYFIAEQTWTLGGTSESIKHLTMVLALSRSKFSSSIV